MQKQQPVTKVHELLDLIKYAHARGTNQTEGVRYFVDLIKSETAALISVSDEVLDLMAREDVQASYNAVVEAGINRLPYPKMVVEFNNVAKGRMHYVVTLEEVTLPSMKVFIKSYVHFMDGETGVVDMNDGFVLAIASPGLIELHAHSMPTQVVKTETVEVYKGCVAFAIYVALVMLNTRGIAKTVIETHALNKKRIRLGKTPVPSHTRVSLGVVYKRDDKGEYYGSHKGMPVHLRSAHTRMQPCGPNNEERKLVFIPACIVNYVPDVEPKQPMKHLVP